MEEVSLQRLGDEAERTLVAVSLHACRPEVSLDHTSLELRCEALKDSGCPEGCILYDVSDREGTSQEIVGGGVGHRPSRRTSGSEGEGYFSLCVEVERHRACPFCPIRTFQGGSLGCISRCVLVAGREGKTEEGEQEEAQAGK